MKARFGIVFSTMLLCAAAWAAPEIEVDVAVVGGGSAGFAAAWSAATLGSSVALVEKESVLGGTSTIGGVNNWEPVWGATGVPRRVYERLVERPGRAGVYEFVQHCSWTKKGERRFPGGLLRVNPDLPYDRTLRRHGPGMGNEAWFRENCHGVIFEPSAMEEVMVAMLRETGRCQVLLGTACMGVDREGGRAAALRLSDGGTVRAKVVVDACGAVCAMMGCEMMRGREAKSEFGEPGAPDKPSGRMNGATLIYRVATRGDGAESLHELPPGVPEKCWWGSFPYAFCCTYPNGDVGVNMLPTMAGDEAARRGENAAYEECRRRVHAHWRWMQTVWPDFRRYRLKEIAPVLALRETVRVRGEYVLNQNDLIAGVGGQRHGDVIALADHCMDSHGGGGPGGELRSPYGIPYRCLLPKGTENVLVAGRCASFSAIAASSCRLSRTMMQLGEAAGAAAHLAVARGVALREVPPADIRAVMERRLDRRSPLATNH
jgi:hypothetical protein